MKLCRSTSSGGVCLVISRAAEGDRATSRLSDCLVESTGQFEVKVITPPPRSLGVHVLPPDTHNGDQIEVDGSVGPCCPCF